MKISLNTIREMNQREGCTGDIAPDGVDKLVEKIGAQLGGIDEVIDFGKKYQGIVVAKIVGVAKHDNADKLSVCKINDGGMVKNVERDENGHVQVVCAAPNVREGLLVAWLPPGVTVPSTVDKDPFVLEAKDFRGQLSNGMLASSKELGLSDDHDGILELPEDQAKPGDDFAKAFGLNDYIIDIENKMFTHRPDLFGFLGVARELAGIQNMSFKSPEWYIDSTILEKTSPRSLISQDENSRELRFEVKNELPELVPRFTAITMRDVKVGPSPLWLQIFLCKMGQKSINNIVDYTNFFMLETGQPLHAYDYDKVKARSNNEATIVVRYPKKGEKIKLLNGKEIEPREQAVMIATDKELIGIGGVMGGGDTEVDENTTNIILECASFDMYSIRRTSMHHGLFTDAVTRFTKGQSPLQNLSVLAKIVDEIKKKTGGKVASEVIDIQKEPDEDKIILVTTHFINDRLGLNLSLDEMTQLLKNVEMKVSDEDGSSHPNPGEKDYPVLLVFPPFWRTDLEIPEDIVEEIGRLYGYDRLPHDLPKRSITPVGPDAMLRFKQTLRRTLAGFGANEVLTYSFVHGDLLQKINQNKNEAYKITNALSPDLQYYRLSLTPSLLSRVHQNVKAGFDSFALFELGKTHSKKNEPVEGVPKETDVLSLVIARSDKKNVKNSGAPFYDARAYLDQLASQLGIELVYYPATRDPELAMTAPFELSRSAFVTVKDSKAMLGIVGEYKKSVQEKLKLPIHTSGFEIGMVELLQQSGNKSIRSYQALSRYPGTWQDLCIQVAPSVSYQEVYQAVQAALLELPLRSQVGLIDIYQPPSATYKNITLRISLSNPAKTLVADDAKAAVDKVAQHVTGSLKATIV